MGCGASERINGCEAAQAVDRTERDEIEVAFAGPHGHSYSPACIRARVGSTLVFRGPFELHPLGAGRLVGGVPDPLPGNPLRDTSESQEARFALETPGAYGFFCHFHTGEGMMGAVFVE
jgi:plastocyanin